MAGQRALTVNGQSSCSKESIKNGATGLRHADASPPLTVKAFGVPDKGRVRTTNEDQFLIAELTKEMRVWQTSLPEPKLQVGEKRTCGFGG